MHGLGLGAGVGRGLWGRPCGVVRDNLGLGAGDWEGGQRKALGGFGKPWGALGSFVGLGRPWEAPEDPGRFWRVPGWPRRPWVALRGQGRPWEALWSFRMFWKAMRGSGRSWEAIRSGCGNREGREVQNGG